MTSYPKTVIFWGAGATASLGIRTTEQQARFLQELTGAAERKPKSKDIRARVTCALRPSSTASWIDVFTNFLIVLGDSETEKADNANPTSEEMAIMRGNWHGHLGRKDIKDRIMSLRNLYDWRALKAIIRVCPSSGTDGFQLQDLFNVLDIHSQSGHGFRDRESQFLTPQRVIGARNALDMILHAMFYVDWQILHGCEAKKAKLYQHYKFAKNLGRRMQRDGRKLSTEGKRFDHREFYLGDVAFISLNYDPIGLWLQFVANRNLNRGGDAPLVCSDGSPAYRLQIFHGLAHFIPGQRVCPKKRGTPWYPMNETAAQRLNDEEHGASQRVRISKFLFPHGCLCWRECPDCGKLSSYMGDEWQYDSRTLIPPPPFAGFTENVRFYVSNDSEGRARKRGQVDTRACVHCGTLTFLHHTSTVMQTNFKVAPPPFLEEIQRDMRVLVQNAEHIVFMGYSLPPDDIAYRVLFAARQRRSGKKPVRCSVVVGVGHDDRWHPPPELPDLINKMEPCKPPRSTLEAARDLFGESHVRFYGGGIPKVFLDGNGNVSQDSTNTLLEWSV